MPTLEDFPRLTGRQEPEHLSMFDGDDTLGRRAVRLGQNVRMKPFPWQADCVCGMMRVGIDGLWTHPDVLLLVPRQNGKTEILILRVLFGLYKLGEKIIFSSQRWATSLNTYKRLSGLIKSRPDLRAEVVENTKAPGSAYIELKNGAQITFITRSSDSGRGLDKVDLIIYDEAYNLTEAETSGLEWTQMASRNPQTIYASSAANEEQHINCRVLAGQRRRGLERGEGLYFREHMAPEGPAWDEVETAQIANPSFGMIQTKTKILNAIRKARTAAARRSYGVEALGRGIWPAADEEREDLLDTERWHDMTDQNPTLVGPRAIGLDLAPDRRHWAVVAAQRTSTGRVFIEVGFWRVARHDTVVKFLEAIVQSWDPDKILVDGRSLAKVIVPRLQAVGIEPDVASTPQMAAWTGGFLDDALDGLLAHPGQEETQTAWAAATKRMLPQGDFVFERDMDTPVLIAAALAYGGIIGTPEQQAVQALPSTAAEEHRPAPPARELDLLTMAF